MSSADSVLTMSPQDMMVHPALLKSVKGDAFEREWVFWSDMWAAKPDAAAVGGAVHVLREVGTVRCMKEYWSYFNGLPLCNMQPASSLHLCVGGVRPTSEDPAHRAGGRLKLDCSTSNIGFKKWLDLCLAVLGGQFPNSALITGVSFSGTGSATLWLKERNDGIQAFLQRLLAKGGVASPGAEWSSNEAASKQSLSRGVVRECVPGRTGRRRSTSAPSVPPCPQEAAVSLASPSKPAALEGEEEDVARLSAFVGKKRVSIRVGSQIGGVHQQQQPAVAAAAPAKRAPPGHRRRHTDSGKEEFIPKHTLTCVGAVQAVPADAQCGGVDVHLHAPVPPNTRREQVGRAKRHSVAWRGATDQEVAAAAPSPVSQGMPPAQPFIHLGSLYPEGLTRKQRRAILFSHGDAEELGCPPGKSLPFPAKDGMLTNEEYAAIYKRAGF